MNDAESCLTRATSSGRIRLWTNRSPTMTLAPSPGKDWRTLMLDAPLLLQTRQLSKVAMQRANPKSSSVPRA